MSRKIKFYLDEHVPRAVLQGLRERGVDVKTVSEAGLLSASDNAHVQHARAERRVIFSQDSDFLRLHAAGDPHCGIVYAPQGTSIREIIHGLMLLHQILDADEMEGHVEFL
jgi:predicted nuclease of predicted toxin-antitoxin system